MSFETKLPPSGSGVATMVLTAEHIVQASLAAHRHRQELLRSLEGQDVVQFDEDTFIVYPPGMRPLAKP